MPRGRPRLDDANERHPLYSEWLKIRHMCFNSSDTHYPMIGGRGITLDERWWDFRNFARDMGPRPSPEHQIVRVDPLGNFDPFNCVWAVTPPNKYAAISVTWGIRTQSAVAWARELNIPVSVFQTRLRRWSIDRAITAPYSAQGARKRRRARRS